MALVSGQHWLDVVALTVPLLLLVHWSLCSARFLSWVFQGRREQARNQSLPSAR